MMMMTITSMTLSLMMMFLSHPLSTGLTLLLQTTIMSIMSSYMNINSMYSYILFLVLIGGMMVLFIYMTSIASNEKFTMKTNLIFIPVIVTIMVMLIFNDFKTSMMMKKSETINEMLNNTAMMFNKNWSNPLYMNSIFIFIYLLITMIATIKITKMNSGPLRHMY